MSTSSSYLNEGSTSDSQWSPFTVVPWVGKEYGRSCLSPDKRILIVGHSTYIDEDLSGYRQNPEVVRSWLISDTSKARDGDRPSKFWTNIMQIMTDTAPNSWSLEDQRLFWDSIALYNFIQRIQQPGLHQAQKQDYEVALDKFKFLLDGLNPTHICIFSADVFDFLSEELGTDNLREFEIEGAGGISKVLRLRHPSWPISRAKWAPAVRAFLNQ